jgi:cupin 2 domain-containing protein
MYRSLFRAVNASVRNLFGGIPSLLAQELVEVLLETPTFRLERIVSMGHVTPPGEWYDQETVEWVLVVSGRARLRFENEATAVTMGPGDFVVIPAHRRHRVEWTAPEEPTVWLALHYAMARSIDGSPAGP